MNTTDTEATSDADDEDFAEQWDDLQHSCSQCEQFAQALAFIWGTIGGVPDSLQRRRGISAAHFLACQLGAQAGSLEFDLRTLNQDGAASS